MHWYVHTHIRDMHIHIHTHYHVGLCMLTGAYTHAYTWLMAYIYWLPFYSVMHACWVGFPSFLRSFGGASREGVGALHTTPEYRVWIWQLYEGGTNSAADGWEEKVSTKLCCLLLLEISRRRALGQLSESPERQVRSLVSGLHSVCNDGIACGRS